MAPPHATPGIHRVEVTDFEEEGDTRGLTRSLTIALTRFTGLRVYCAETALRPPADIDAAAARPELAADCLVTGQTSLRPDGFDVDVILVEAERDRAFWAETFDRRLKSSEIIALRNELANRVARALAQPYGAIQSDRERDADGRAPERPGSHTAVLLFYASWRNFERAVASTAAGLGRDDEAVGAIRGLDSEHGAHIVADVRSRDAAPGLARRIIAGVEKAGLTITAPERGAHAP